MNNLSNERLRELASGDAWTCIQDDEGQIMARELLALREAGEEPVGIRWRFTDWRKTTMFHHTFDVDRFDEFSKSGNKEVYYTYAAPQLPAVPEYPELLPCPVLLEPGFRFGKGVPTSSMLGALKRRAERQAELDAMSPEAKAEYDASIEKLKSVLMPDGAEQRLAAAVELLKQAAPHMLADGSLKDPDGALCGKMPDLLDIRNELCDNKDHSTGKLCMRPSGHYGACTLSRSAIAAAPKPE